MRSTRAPIGKTRQRRVRRPSARRDAASLRPSHRGSRRRSRASPCRRARASTRPRSSSRSRTEDHPIEYLDFEAVIPEGQLRRGPDDLLGPRARFVTSRRPPRMGSPRASSTSSLTGYKLRGRFALVKLEKSEKGNEWLLIKKAGRLLDDRERRARDAAAIGPLGPDGRRAREGAGDGRRGRVARERLGAKVGDVVGHTIAPMLCARARGSRRRDAHAVAARVAEGRLQLRAQARRRARHRGQARRRCPASRTARTATRPRRIPRSRARCRRSRPSASCSTARSSRSTRRACRTSSGSRSASTSRTRRARWASRCTRARRLPRLRRARDRPVRSSRPLPLVCRREILKQGRPRQRRAPRARLARERRRRAPRFLPRPPPRGHRREACRFPVSRRSEAHRTTG